MRVAAPTSVTVTVALLQINAVTNAGLCLTFAMHLRTHHGHHAFPALIPCILCAPALGINATHVRDKVPMKILGPVWSPFVTWTMCLYKEQLLFS